MKGTEAGATICFEEDEEDEDEDIMRTCGDLVLCYYTENFSTNNCFQVQINY